MNIAHRTMHHIQQDLIIGLTLPEISDKYGLSPEDLAQYITHLEQTVTPSVRRQLALLRLDKMAAVLYSQSTGEDPDLARQAILAYTQVQKREAALTGLDQPVKVDSDVRVQVAWLQPGRLAYRDGKELAEDIAQKAAPQLPAPEDLGD